MGLSIQVGLYEDLSKNDSEGADWFLNNMNKINLVLEKNEIEQFEEPSTLGVLNNRAKHNSFPYSFIHYLRRFYANVVIDSDWEPTVLAEGENPEDDHELDCIRCDFESHLVSHSDSEGFYLPIDFEEVFIDDDEIIPGSFLCSSYQLLSELTYMAPFMGIQLDNGSLSDEAAQTINDYATKSEEFFREHAVWLSLYEAARLSIEHKTAIVFT